jgi:2-haloacid dehalogenase
LSNWSAETFPLVKDKFEVFGMLDGIVMSGEELIGKPDLRIYQILLERYGLQAEECVFIDDRLSNIEAGEKVGIQGIVFKNCEQAKLEFTERYATI